MGIAKIFDESADLSGINPNIYVSSMIHKSFIEVTEKGTSAAAVTVSLLQNKSSPSKIVANKPFLYFIVDNATKLILFSGQYARPRVF